MKPTQGEIVYVRSGRGHLIATILICATLIAGISYAQTKPVLIPAWDASDESNVDHIDHSAWQDILNDYLHVHSSGINRVDYADLKANTRDTAKLAEYLAYLQKLEPRDYSRAEQKAYWINFYNALTVHVVVEAYPVDSIQEISNSFLKRIADYIHSVIPVDSIREISDSLLEGWTVPGPWSDVRANVAGLDLTLDNIEHGILRPIYRDNRIHYAVNCASMGCPNLSPTAFTAANTETLLDAGARAYVNHLRGVDFVDDDFIVISSMYNWFAEDFGGSEESLIEHLTHYAEKELAERLRNFKGSVDFEYDWSLNQP